MAAQSRVIPWETDRIYIARRRYPKTYRRTRIPAIPNVHAFHSQRGYFYSENDITLIGMPQPTSLLLDLWEWIRGLFRPSPADPIPPASTPTTPPTISPAVRQFVLVGHTLNEQENLKRQIAEAEAAGLRSFTLNYPGGYYRIVDGQIVESGRYT